MEPSKRPSEKSTFSRKRPGIVIAAMKGGGGKTIATLGIIRALSKEGTGIIPFKKGPDYIDARWMAMAAGTDCYNLDPYLMTRDVIEASYRRREQQGEMCVMEGNRGLFDGVDVRGSCSTAELAKWLCLPVLLVVDCTKVTRTTAALVSGCANFDPDIKIAGVILNHIVRPRHEDIITRSIELYTNIPVTGAIPRMKKDPLPMRHLGLTPADEHSTVTELLDSLADAVGKAVDLEKIKAIASEGVPTDTVALKPSYGPAAAKPASSIEDKAPCVAIVRDAAFQFYYPENIEAIKRAGAHVIFLDALSDTAVPDEVNALYIGGGFPETQAERLSANSSFRHSLKEKAMSGLPIYAECGGLMYLGQNIIWQGQSWPMSGIIDWDFRVQKKPAGHGYSIIEVREENPFFAKGTRLKGHEFHYSVPEPAEKSGEQDRERFSCTVKRGHGFIKGLEGITIKNVFATYTHIHVLGHPEWGENIVKAASLYRQAKK